MNDGHPRPYALAVSEDEAERLRLAALLRRAGLSPAAAPGWQALRLVRHGPAPRVVLLGQRRHPEAAASLLDELRRDPERADLPVFVWSEGGVPAETLERGVRGWLRPGDDPGSLLEELARCGRAVEPCGV
jgi:CheY-like chemotaxis protein